ncbi:MAG: tetratricopeptide repeat protein [Actinomycetota bacterium]
MQNLTAKTELKGQGRRQRYWASAITSTLLLLWLCAGTGAKAQSESSELDQFSPNPLELTTSDPLLPNPPKEGESLSPANRQELAAALNQLNLEALAFLQGGDAVKAFETWNRELRLRRYLGPIAEMEALGRVGRIALDNGQRVEAQFITQRLLAMQKALLTQETVNLEQLQALGLAFQQVQAKGPTVEVYQKITEEARSRQDVIGEAESLRAIGKIHLKWLNYEKAAVVYENLAELIQEHRDLFLANAAAFNGGGTRGTNATSGSENAPAPTPPPTEEESLKQLAYIYTQARKPLQAIAVREKLIALYMNQQNLRGVPPLKIAIASDYETLGQRNLASQYYQEAYNLAVGIQQFAHASDALERLAALYRSQKQMEAALKIYQMQLVVQQQSYNLYGLMDTYDRIGEVYKELKAYRRALEAFQKGLEVATQLNHRQEYFAKKIQKVNRQMGVKSSQ